MFAARQQQEDAVRADAEAALAQARHERWQGALEQRVVTAVEEQEVVTGAVQLGEPHGPISALQ